MKRLLIVNPNSTEAMTARIAEVASGCVPRAIEIIARTNHAGPPAIEGARDGALAAPGMLEILFSEPYDAALIACFDDTGLDAAREISAAPVIGMGAASFHLAAAIASRFLVVTTTPRSVPVIEENILREGLGSRCAGVKAAGIRVLDLEDGRDAAIERVAAAAVDGAAGAVVLGCAGMAGLTEWFAERTGRLAIDPVTAGVSAAAWAALAHHGDCGRVRADNDRTSPAQIGRHSL